MHCRSLIVTFVLALAAVTSAHAAPAAAADAHAPARPKITGISHLAVYTSNPAATDHYYREVIGAVKLARS